MNDQSSDAGLSRLPLRMRGMVLRLATALLQEGYRQDKAFLIAIGQVEEWMHAQARNPTAKANYHVTPHPLGWVVRHPDGANPCLVFKTCDEAIQFGQALAQQVNANLVVHAPTGEVQSKYVYH